MHKKLLVWYYTRYCNKSRGKDFFLLCAWEKEKYWGSDFLATARAPTAHSINFQDWIYLLLCLSFSRSPVFMGVTLICGDSWEKSGRMQDAYDKDLKPLARVSRKKRRKFSPKSSCLLWNEDSRRTLPNKFMYVNVQGQYIFECFTIQLVWLFNPIAQP